MEFSLDPTSYADFSSVNHLKNEIGAIIAHIGMTERYESLSDRTSKISKVDVEDSVKLMEEENLNKLQYYEYGENYDKAPPIPMYKKSDKTPTYQEEEYGINYLLTYVYLYYKVVSNYEVRFRTKFEFKETNFLGILGELGFDITKELFLDNDLENNINFEMMVVEKDLDTKFNKLNDLLRMILSGDSKSKIDTEITSSRGGGMKGGNPIGFAAVMAKPIAAIWHLGRVAFLRDKVLDKLNYLYIVDGQLGGVLNNLKPNKTTKLNRKDMNVIFLGKILNAELVNIFRTCYYSLLRTRGAGLNKIGDMLLKVGMCKSRIVYFVLYNNYTTNQNKIFLVYMYLRPRGVKNIYVHRFEYKSYTILNKLINHIEPNTIDVYNVRKIEFDHIKTYSHFEQDYSPNEFLKKEIIKEYFKKNHQYTMCYDIDYLVNKIDYAVKCETHALAGKNKYDSIAARIVTLYKDKRYLFRTRRIRKNRDFYTIPDKIITIYDIKKMKKKKIPELLYLFNILENGLGINIDRNREELIKLVKEKEDEEVVDTELHEPMLRSGLYTVNDSDILPLQNNWMENNTTSSTSTGGGRKMTKKNVNKIKNKTNNKIYSKKVRLN